jgi:hypothetical protein
MAFAATDHLTKVVSASSNFVVEDGILYNEGKTVLLLCPRNRSGALKIPATVTAIGDWGFFRRNGITAVDFSAATKLDSLGERAFSCTALKSLVLPCSVRSLGACFMSDIHTLTELTFETGILIDRIPSGAFSLTRLTVIEVPQSVRRLERSSFHSTSLTTLTYEADSQLTEVESDALCSTNLRELILPRNFSQIGSEILTDAPNLTRITIDPENRHYIFEGGLLTDRARETIVVASRPIETYSVPATVRVIGGRAFHMCKKLPRIDISLDSQLTAPGRYGFADSVIREIWIPPQVKVIGDRCFSSCEQPTSVRFHPDSVLETLGEGRSPARRLTDSSLVNMRKFARVVGMTAITSPSPIPIPHDSSR